MNGFYILFIVIIAIIAVSKSVMEYLKALDRRNGLEIDDRNYSVKGTLFSSINQDKRINKENRKTFKEHNIDYAMWKKSVFLYTGSALCSIGESIYENNEIASIIVISIFVAIHFFSKKMFYLIMVDISFLLMILKMPSNLVAVLIISPSVIIYNYVVIKDYIQYRKETT